MKLRKYTLQDLQESIRTSVSVRECLIKLNVSPYGGNYYIFNRAVKHFKLDTSHFTGQNLKGRKLPQRRLPLNEYLQNGSNINTHRLKKYLLEENVFQPVCTSCNLTEWLNEPIPLELDHIDGNNTNNEVTNLRLLCPNCHARTDTYRGKNKKKS